jgi:signal transduction histidine kinase
MRREPFGPAKALAAISAGLCEECADVNLAVTGMVDIALVGDGDAFRRILENLVRNAARAMDGRGAVNVDFSEHGKSLVMRVTDTGPGVPAEVREHIFEPFVSGSAAGTGLGLAIVKTLCDRNGWTIGLAPSPQGACFICTFPEGTWQKS